MTQTRHEAAVAEAINEQQETIEATLEKGSQLGMICHYE